MITLTWQSVITFCAGLATVATAIGIVVKGLYPVFNIKKEIKDLKSSVEFNAERIEQNEETNKLVCRALLILLDVAEMQEKDYPTTLKDIKEIKQDMQAYLLDKIVVQK